MKEQKQNDIPHVVLVLDGSGSMRWAEGLVNKALCWLVDEQAMVLAPCLLSVYVFRGSMIQCICRRRMIHQRPTMTFSVHGSTNARDALHHAVEESVNANDKQTMVCLLTDGDDGISMFSLAQTATMVRTFTAQGWLFTYIAFGSAAPGGDFFGIPEDNCIRVGARGHDYDDDAQETSTTKAVRAMVTALSRAMTAFRGSARSSFGQLYKAALKQIKSQQTAGERA